MSKKVNISVPQDRIFYNQDNIQGEMMRYRTNSTSYKLVMLAIAFSVLSSFISFNSLSWNVDIIFKILGNIVILLFGFLSIEKVKAYSKEYSYVLCAFGVISFLRILWCPLLLITHYTAYLADNKVIGRLGPTITSSSPYTNAFLPADGYVRAGLAIGFLVISGVSFLASGLVGLIKAKQYQEYMKDQDVSKGV